MLLPFETSGQKLNSYLLSVCYLSALFLELEIEQWTKNTVPFFLGMYIPGVELVEKDDKYTQV